MKVFSNSLRLGIVSFRVHIKFVRIPIKIYLKGRHGRVCSVDLKSRGPWLKCSSMIALPVFVLISSESNALTALSK